VIALHFSKSWNFVAFIHPACAQLIFGKPGRLSVRQNGRAWLIRARESRDER